MLHVLLKCNLDNQKLWFSRHELYCVTGVPSFLTSAGMLVMFKSSMSSCQRLESCPSSIGSSWIPGLLQRQEGFKSKLRKSKQNIMTSCEFLKQEAGEMNKPFWYCILVWLLQLLTFTHTVKTLNHPLWLLGSGPNPSALLFNWIWTC